MCNLFSCERGICYVVNNYAYIAPSLFSAAKLKYYFLSRNSFCLFFAKN